jgi:hypothetical protein
LAPSMMNTEVYEAPPTLIGTAPIVCRAADIALAKHNADVIRPKPRRFPLDRGSIRTAQ